MDDETLLDVFMRLQPDPNWQQVVDTATNQAIDRVNELFANAAPPRMRAPVIPTPTAGGIGGRAGGGGTAPGNALRDQYVDALRAAEDLTVESRRLGFEISNIGAEELSNQFRLAKLGLEDIVTLLRRGRQDDDPLALQDGIDRLDAIRLRLQQIRTEAQPALGIRSEFDYLVEQEKVNRQRFAAERALAQSLERGQPSGEIRVKMAELTEEVKRAQIEFDALVRAFDNSPQALERLQNKAEELVGNFEEGVGRAGFRNLDQQARASVSSLNTLQNNAFQLGQAFEDAAVGFQLNGISGAIRGSANNISFLIQNYAQLRAQQAAFNNEATSGFTRLLPLYGSIGAAVALTVIPPLVDWLSTLNDIEVETNNIASKLQENFSDIEFKVGLDVGEIDLRRQLAEAGSLDDITKKLKDLNAEADKGKFRIKEIFSEFAKSGDLKAVNQQLEELNKAIDVQRAKLQESLQPLGQNVNRSNRRALQQVLDLILVGEGPGQLRAVRDARNRFDLKQVEDFAKEYGSIIKNLEKARISAISGTANPEQLRSTETQLRGLRDNVAEFAKTLDTSDKEFGEKIKASVTALEQEFGKIQDISEQVASVTRSFNDALDAGDRKAGQLAQRLELIRSTIQGVSREQSLFLFDLQAVTDEYERQIQSSANLTDLQKQRAIAQAQQNNLLQLAEREVQLREDLKQIEQNIADIREKDRRSQFLSLDAFNQRIQINALAPDNDKKRLEELLKERERQLDAIARGQIAAERVRGGGNFGDIGVQFQGGRFAVPSPIDKNVLPGDRMIQDVLVRGFFEMVEQQKKTTEAIQSIDVKSRVSP